MPLKFAILTGAALVALTAAFFGPSVSPASATQAKFVRCLATPLSVIAIGHGMWGTNERTRTVAISNWQSAATGQIGTYYGSWANALGGTIDCHRALFKVTCIATATPCRT